MTAGLAAVGRRGALSVGIELDASAFGRGVCSCAQWQTSLRHIRHAGDLFRQPPEEVLCGHAVSCGFVLERLQKFGRYSRLKRLDLD